MTSGTHTPRALDESLTAADRAALEERLEVVRSCPCCGTITIYSPLIICTHCGKELPIETFVYKRNRKFYAECLTLNIRSRGETEADAIIHLQRAMFAYVETVLQDGKSAKGLIPRYSPLSSWLLYYRMKITRRIRRWLGQPYVSAIRAIPEPEAVRFTVMEC